MIPGSFEYYASRSLDDAVKYLAAPRDEVKFLSGGQSRAAVVRNQRATLKLSKTSTARRNTASI